MSIFYTKDQTDDLAGVIGERIKASVSETNVVNALNNSSQFHLLTTAEKAEILNLLETGIVGSADDCCPPATDITSFIDALDNGFVLQGEGTPPDLATCLPTETTAYKYYGGSSGPYDFYGKYRVNNGPWITYTVKDEYDDPTGNFLKTIKGPDGRKLFDNENESSFFFDIDNNLMKGFASSGEGILEAYPVKVEFILSEGDGGDLSYNTFYPETESTIIYSCGRSKSHIMPKGSFLLLKPDAPDLLKDIVFNPIQIPRENIEAGMMTKYFSYLTGTKGAGLHQGYLDSRATDYDWNEILLDGSKENHYQYTVLEMIGEYLRKPTVSNPAYDETGVTAPDIRSGFALRSDYLNSYETQSENISEFTMSPSETTLTELNSSNTTRFYPKESGERYNGYRREYDSYDNVNNVFGSKNPILQNVLDLILDPSDPAYLEHPLYAEGYTPIVKSGSDYIFTVTNAPR